MNQKNMIKKSGLYVLLVLSFTYLIGTCQSVQQLETHFYDEVQQYLAIKSDSESDCTYSRYEKALDQLCVVDVTAESMDSETDRLDIDALADFLEKIAPYKADIKGIFLDYSMNPDTTHFSAEDKATMKRLVAAVRSFGPKMVLPYTIDFPKDAELDKVTLADATNISYPHHKERIDAKYGYLLSLIDQRNSNRYFRYKLPTNADKNAIDMPSIPYILSEMMQDSTDLATYVAGLKPINDLNFLLRELPLTTINMSVFNNDSIDTPEKLEQVRNAHFADKLVMVGLFGSYKNKYGQYPDKHTTPIDAQMSGSLLLLNAYLNLQTQTVPQQPIFWMYLVLSLLNFGLFYGYRYFLFGKKEKYKWEPAILLGSNVLFTLLLFPALGVLLWYFCSWKLPIGVSIFCFNQIKIFDKIFSSFGLEKSKT